MRKRREPPCHREFIEYLTALASHDYENEHPKVVPLLKALDKCTEESVRATTTIRASRSRSHAGEATQDRAAIESELPPLAVP